MCPLDLKSFCAEPCQSHGLIYGLEMSTDTLETLKYYAPDCSAARPDATSQWYVYLHLLFTTSHQAGKRKCQPLAANQTKPRPAEVS